MVPAVSGHVTAIKSSAHTAGLVLAKLPEAEGHQPDLPKCFLKSWHALLLYVQVTEEHQALQQQLRDAQAQLAAADAKSKAPSKELLEVEGQLRTVLLALSAANDKLLDAGMEPVRISQVCMHTLTRHSWACRFH